MLAPAGKIQIGVPESLALMAGKADSVLGPIYKILKVSTFEEAVKKVVKLVFTFVLLIPLILLPLYFFFFTLLHL